MVLRKDYSFDQNEHKKRTRECITSSYQVKTLTKNYVTYIQYDTYLTLLPLFDIKINSFQNKPFY